MWRKSSLPWWSVVLGTSSLMLGILTGLPAIISGHLFLRYCKTADVKCRRRDLILTIVGLSFGYLSTATSIIFLILYKYSEYKL
jgi:hypothetical protein